MGKFNKKGLELKQAFKKEMKEKRKNLKNELTAKRAKLVVKNLPFKTNQENLKELFQQYGNVEDVNILKKPDGKMVGCAFVQFTLVQKAAKAKHHLNGHTFLGRKINVDFAKAKDKYKKESRQAEVKSEENDIDLSIVKVEDEEKSDVEIKSESEACSVLNESNSSEEDSNSETDSPLSEQNDEPVLKKPHVVSNDVSEGKTVFIKNVPFSATNEDLKECMSQYGPLYYALVCIDGLTEHSKGTAFVKFSNKEDAEKCLQAGTELTLQGNILDCHPALHKQDLLQKEKEKKVKQKDSRNLYLVKEGVILAGTKASEGVSAADMAKRLQLEQYKTQILRNLNMYISKTRLIIHNLPATWNDSKLQMLFKKYSDQNAVIREARIMRDIRNVDSQGIGNSKEYGFVSFTNHEDALRALRTINNNPTIFSANKRPIVAFSIENRAKLRARERRLERSKIRNPNSKNYDPVNAKSEPPVNQRMEKKNVIRNKKSMQSDTATDKFTGVVASPGVKKMRSKFNLKTQAKLHYENLKMEKKHKKRTAKTLVEKRKDFRKQPRQKLNKKKEEIDNFAVLVNKYKQNLKSVPSKTSKWYE